MPVTHYRWDRLSDNVLMEVDETGATTAEYTNEPNQFGKLISQRRDGADSYYHYDAQLSTRQLTDASQTVTDSYDYTAFGETVASSGTTENPYRYKGGDDFFTRSSVGDIISRDSIYSPKTGRHLVLGIAENKIHLKQEVKDKGCSKCGNFSWTNKISIDFVEGYEDRRSVELVLIQRICFFRREIFCNLDKNGCCKIDLEKENRVMKCCINEILGMFVVSQGKATTVMRDEDTWAYSGTRDRECESRGQALTTSQLFTAHLPFRGELRRKWEESVRKKEGILVSCGKDFTVRVHPGPRELPEDASLRSSFLVRGFWNCCPKPKKGKHCRTINGPVPIWPF